ncbi:MAG: hypothetical protein ACI4GC_06840 [Acutalibacteraceae bacterium]
MTEKIFENDSYLSEFTCKVTDLYSDDNYLYIETDRTAFFPEGGGQTSDIGWLNDTDVENVQIIDERILHFVKKTEENVKKFKIGDDLCGKVNMNKRFSDMQQHTGEHIFSGIVHNLYGYDNVGFHLGKEVVTLDFNGNLTEEDICKVEHLVNKAVWDNLEIKLIYPKKEELSAYDYRSKIEIDGQVRLVEIPGVDLCACCAPHVKRTGEVGLVEVVSCEKYKSGVRVSILCGERALTDVRHKLNENHKISVLTASKEKETSQAVERIQNEKEKLAYDLVGMTRELLFLKAQNTQKQDKIIIFDEKLEGKLLQDFTIEVSKKADSFAACFCRKDGQYKYCIVSQSVDLRDIGKRLTSEFSGRGGGRPNIQQGSLSGNESKIKEFLLNV